MDDPEKEIKRLPKNEEPFSALAFKIMTDPHLGKLTFIRVYSGVLETGSTILNSAKDRKERIGKIFQMHANKREERDNVGAGMVDEPGTSHRGRGAGTSDLHAGAGFPSRLPCLCRQAETCVRGRLMVGRAKYNQTPRRRLRHV